MDGQGFLTVGWKCDECGLVILPNNYMIIQRRGLVENYHRWCGKCFKEEPNKDRLKSKLGNKIVLERYKRPIN